MQSRNSELRKALAGAAITGNLSTVKTLLQEGASLEECYGGCSSLWYAVLDILLAINGGDSLAE